MAIKVSIIIVNFNTPGLLEKLLSQFDLIASSIKTHSFEIIIVNNGGKINKLYFLNNLNPKICELKQNPGYAYALNRGIERSSGDYIFVMNTDLIINTDSINALLESLTQNDIVGPKFYLDEEYLISLPPIERHDFLYLVLKTLAPVHRFLIDFLHRIWWKHVRRHLFAEQIISSYYLSGALLAFRKQIWNEVGPFDESFRLYFEETDWLLRAQNQNYKLSYLASTNVVHFFNQSAQKNNHSDLWYAESREIFERKYFGKSRKLILDLLRKYQYLWSVKSPDSWTRIKRGNNDSFESIFLSGDFSTKQIFMEMSISKLFIPSAIIFLENESLNNNGWEISKNVWDRLAPGEYYFRIVNHKGNQVSP